ncbi:MAG: hypothetical protein RR938_00570, partial [Muribaculaceae bacterium]
LAYIHDGCKGTFFRLRHPNHPNNNCNILIFSERNMMAQKSDEVRKMAWQYAPFFRMHTSIIPAIFVIRN